MGVAAPAGDYGGSSAGTAVHAGPAAAAPGAFLHELRGNWTTLLLAVTGMAFNVAALPFYAIATTTKPLSADLGWSRGAVQAFFSFCITGVVIGSPVIGRLIGRFGMRAVAASAAAGLGIGLIALGLFTRSLPSFYALAFVTALAGSGTSTVLWSQLLFQRFHARPAFMLGLALTLSSCIEMFLPVTGNALQAAYGWRMTFVGFGLLPLCVVLPLTLLIGGGKTAAGAAAVTASRPADGLTLRQALGTRRLWTIALSFFLVMLGTMGINTNLIPLLTDKGFTPAAAARVVGALVGGVVVGRLCTGYLLDRIAGPLIGAVVFALPALSCLILLAPQTNMALTMLAIALVGGATGAELDLSPYLTRRYFGMRSYGSIFGCIFALFATASGVAPPLSGLAFDLTGSYAIVLKAAACCFLAGAALVLTLGRYPRFASVE